MKTIIRAGVALGIMLALGAVAPDVADATRVPWCSAEQPQQEPSIQTYTQDDDCKPIPPPEFVDAVCGADGTVTWPQPWPHGVEYYYLNGEKVPPYTTASPGGTGVIVEVTAEVKGDGDDYPDASWHFNYTDPDCTVTGLIKVDQLDCAVDETAALLTVHAVDHVTYHYADFEVPPGEYAVAPGTYEFHVEADEGYTVPEGEEIIEVTVNPINGCLGEPGEPGEPGLPGEPGAPAPANPNSGVAQPPTPPAARPVVRVPDQTG